MRGKAGNRLVAPLVFLALGCLPGMPEKYRPFFQLPRKTQPAELRARPLEEQLDLYIAGVNSVHPPRIDLGLAIGKQGPAIVPTLLARIRRAPDEHDKANLIWIMVGMPCTTETADSISAALDSMRLEAAKLRNRNAKGSAEHSLQLAENRCRPSDTPLPGPGT